MYSPTYRCWFEDQDPETDSDIVRGQDWSDDAAETYAAMVYADAPGEFPENPVILVQQVFGGERDASEWTPDGEPKRYRVEVEHVVRFHATMEKA